MKRNIGLTNSLLSIIAFCLCLIVLKLYSSGNAFISKALAEGNSPQVVTLDNPEPIKVQIYGDVSSPVTSFENYAPIRTDKNGFLYVLKDFPN